MRFLPHLTIFLGSFLSFFIQPMVGRTLLPVFGGSASVWVTCLVAFQALLLVGSGYAFVPAQGRGGRRVHLTLIAVAAAVAATLPFWKGAALAAASARLSPVAGVCASVLALTGLASLVLSANATVVQSWRGGGREVYRLYVVSNIGSLTGLLAYPLVVEPFVSLDVQWAAFGAAILAYGAMLAGVGGAGAGGAHGGAPGKTLMGEQAGVGGAGKTPAGEPAGVGGPLAWVLLPGASCALMTAATTFITTDFAPLPLMWAVLLAAFLLSYVIGFSRIGERLLPVWIGLSVPVLLFVGWTLLPMGDSLHRFAFGLAAVLLLLLVVGSSLHAALCRVRPETDRLPLFYFCTALGGVLGGVLAGVVAPLAFDWVAEFPLALVAACAALAWAAAGRGAHGGASGKTLTDEWRVEEVWGKIPTQAIWGAFGVAALFIGFAALLGDANGQQRIWRARGFYGAVSVRRDTVRYASGATRELRAFYHGKTVHGTQLPDFPEKPTLYYSLNGGGIAFESYGPRKEGKAIRAGFVGMGVGTMAVYGRAGDVFRFYEISPEAIRVATDTNLFTFVSGSAAKVEIVAEDARLGLARDRAEGMAPFDILVVDAYSGDSVPTHLITREAFALYRSVLKPGGVLALHLSNWHMDLWPVAKAAAKAFGWRAFGTYSGRVLNEFAEETGWAFLTDGAFEPRMPTCCHRIDWERVADCALLEDARGSLLRFLDFGAPAPVEGE